MEEKFELKQNERKESIKIRIKYFIIEMAIVYTALIGIIGWEEFSEKISMTDNIKIIIILLVIADVIYILKKKINWKEGVKVYLLWKFIAFSIIDILFR